MFNKRLIVLVISLLIMTVCGMVYADTGGRVVGTKIRDYTIEPWDCAAGGFKVVYQFASTDISASESDTDIETAGGTTANYFHTMPYAGSVVGISISSNAAITAAALTVTVTINGTETDFTAYLRDDGTYTTYHYNTQDRVQDTFTAGQRIGVSISSDAALIPDGSADITVSVIVGQ